MELFMLIIYRQECITPKSDRHTNKQTDRQADRHTKLRIESGSLTKKLKIDDVQTITKKQLWKYTALHRPLDEN